MKFYVITCSNKYHKNGKIIGIGLSITECFEVCGLDKTQYDMKIIEQLKFLYLCDGIYYFNEVEYDDIKIQNYLRTLKLNNILDE